MKVLLLAGGNSSEREVSLNSGKAIAEALRHLGHELSALDPGTGLSLMSADGKYLPEGVPGTNVARLGGDVPAIKVSGSQLKECDIVFLALHGGAGENGTIQSLLELSGVAYTGSGVAASAIAMDKALTKLVMKAIGIPTPSWHVVRGLRSGVTEKLAEQLLTEVGLPLIVKPNDGGSTVGLTKVTHESQLSQALRLAAQETGNVLVECCIVGRELTVAVLNSEPLPVVEIRPKSGLYDYTAKYTKGMSEYLAPAPIEDDLARTLQEYSLALYQMIGANGLARVDFMLSEAGQPYCLEINTLPGMTNLSLAPMAAGCVGISFDKLVQRILDSAIKPHCPA